MTAASDHGGDLSELTIHGAESSSAARARCDHLAARIVRCQKCPRLRDHCRQVAVTKRRAFRDQEYWGKPVPSFGDPDPRLLVVGLAPGAHGANRTGRVFTGDPSGDWLYRALFATGFANQARSIDRHDGLQLIDARISGAARCAPPQNRPTAEELAACRPFLREEIAASRRLRVILALGKVAHDAVRRAWIEAKLAPFPAASFAHGAEVESVVELDDAPKRAVSLLSSYHPSRQNTQTGRLDRRMFHRCFRRARQLLEAPASR